MSDTSDLTEQLPSVPDADGCAPPLRRQRHDAVDAQSLRAGGCVHIGRDQVAQQPAAPHRGPVNAESSIIGLLEVIERDSTKHLAELDFAEDKAENGSNVGNGSTVWDSVGASFSPSACRTCRT